MEHFIDEMVEPLHIGAYAFVTGCVPMEDKPHNSKETADDIINVIFCILEFLFFIIILVFVFLICCMIFNNL